MDHIHAEFQEMLLRAQLPGTPDWLPLLTELDAHMRSHFAAEDAWMTETGFPPRGQGPGLSVGPLTFRSNVPRLPRLFFIIPRQTGDTMLCRRCGIFGDRVRPKWWHRFIPGVHRYYCAGCGRKYLAFGNGKGPVSGIADRPLR